MKNLPDELEKFEYKMYEIECLIKCIRNLLDVSIDGKEDYSYLQPIAEIACRKIDTLSDDYTDIATQIYKKFIIAK